MKNTIKKPGCNEPLFTLRNMLDCWVTAQESFSKEIGGDIDELEEDGYVIPMDKKAYFKEEYDIELK